MNSIQHLVLGGQKSDHHMCTNCNNVTTIDCDTVVKYFLSEYYHKTSNIGWNAVTHLFSPDCKVFFKIM